MTIYPFTPPDRPVPVLLDTDMATDCDDAGALAVLHALAARGEAKILGMLVNNRDPVSVGAVSAINTYYGRPDIPLGAYMKEAIGAESAQFVQELALDLPAYGHPVATREQVPDAVSTARAALQTAPDCGAVIVSIGHLNNLADLLDADPELLKQKVRHLVVMGGDYPEGTEHNFAARGSAPSAHRVVRDWPTPVLFTGYTLGERVVTGPELARLPVRHPVRRAYAGHSSRPLERGRPSWDQTAVLAAVRGISPWWTLGAPGRNRVHPDGSNIWEEDANGPHAYLVEKLPPEDTAREISRLMTQLPTPL